MTRADVALLPLGEELLALADEWEKRGELPPADLRMQLNFWNFNNEPWSVGLGHTVPPQGKLTLEPVGIDHGIQWRPKE